MQLHYGAATKLKDAQLELRVATHQLEDSQSRLTDAQKQAIRMAREFGGGSAQHKQALTVVRQENDAVALSEQRVQKAREQVAHRTRENTEAEQKQAAAMIHSQLQLSASLKVYSKTN